MRARAPACAALMALAVLLGGCAGEEQPADGEQADGPGEPGAASERARDEDGLPLRPGAHVLLVTIDALRADHVGAYGYERGITENIDAVAEGGVVFEHAWAQAPHSSWSLCSTMTSEYLHETTRIGGPVLEATLASVLAEEGYHGEAYYTDGIFYTDAEALGAYERSDLGFEVHDGDNPDAEERTDRVLAAMDRVIEDGEPPSLFWVHYFEPHEPYRETALGDSALDRYDGEIRNADRAVGRLVREARRRLDREVIVVVTADHGEELRDHGGISHGSKLYEEQVHVPLVVQVPGLEPRRVAEPVELVDVTPTLLGLLGVEPAATMRGDDLRPLLVGRDMDPGPAHAAVSTRHAVLSWPDKLIAELAYGQLERYDLERDPAEREPLPTEGEETDALVAELHAWHDSLRAAPGELVDDDPQVAALQRGRLHDDRAAVSLAHLVADASVEPERRAEGARLLGELRAAEGRRALRHALGSREPVVRAEAAVALGLLGDQGARAALVASLQEVEDADLHARVAIALGRLGDHRAVPALNEVLREPHPYEIERDACRCLYRLRDPRAVDALLALTEDSRLRYRAITALGLARDERAYEPLVAMLDDGPRAMIRDGIVRALGFLGDRRALPRLVRMARDNPELISASESLVRLGSIDEGLVGGADVGPASRGLEGLGPCHRGDRWDVGYRGYTWCEMSGGRATVPLAVPDGEHARGVLVLGLRGLGETAEPATVRVTVGDTTETLQVGGDWADHRFELPWPADGADAVLEPQDGARLGLEHILLLPQ